MKVENEKYIHKAILINLNFKKNGWYSSPSLKHPSGGKRAFNIWVLDGIKGCLEELLRESKYCSRCGALLPELSFLYEGVNYDFVCYRIRKNEEVIAETDYKRFGEYCRKRFPQQRLKKEKEP